MNDAALTPERILDAAEEVLRRFGPAKTTVVDVARALGVSHGAVYRHFPSKAALRDAVVARWLDRISAPLDQIANADGPALDRLRNWFDLLRRSKQEKLRGDPELFSTYMALASDARDVVAAHVGHLVDNVTRIVANGVAQGTLAVTDSRETARTLLDATARFHHPAHAAEWADPQSDAAFERLWALIVRGLVISHHKIGEYP